MRGRPLYAWALKKNPTAREVAWMVRWVARQLAQVHAAGVVHRDIKGSNVLVGKKDGRPVLVDFGVGTYVGAPEITNPLGLPGTRHYRSPEALRFRRERAGEHSPARTTDDLWALGVVLYWLLTGSYPFDTEVPDEGALADVILKHEPTPPHVLNPRVPRALSELCLRMLEKSPQARFPVAGAVEGALEAVLAEADANWDVPLCEQWGPEDATTPQETWLDWGDMRDKARRLLEYARRFPRRGRPEPLSEASTLSRSPEEPPPGVDGDGARDVRHRAGLWGCVLGLCVLGALVITHHCSTRASEFQATTSAVTSPATTSGVGKLAPASKPPESGDGAALEKASEGQHAREDSTAGPSPSEAEAAGHTALPARHSGKNMRPGVGRGRRGTGGAHPSESRSLVRLRYARPEGGVVVEERERFRQVALSEDGLMLNLLPSDGLAPGRRLRLTVRFADGATPTSLDFTLVVSPRAEPQVEVYRAVRPCDSYRQQAEEAEARARHYQTLLARERAERGTPRGIIGLLVLEQMGEDGIRSKPIALDIVPRPGNAFTVLNAVSYRATRRGENDTGVTRLAVALLVQNQGSKPWMPTHARLVSEGVRWDVEVGLPQPLSPGETGHVLMEVARPGRTGSGPYLLQLWDDDMTRAVTFSGVTFP